MKKIVTVTALALVLGLSGEAFARGGYNQQPAGGFTGPTISAISVGEAKKLSDDTPVVLTGKIVRSLGSEKYEFKDKTGSVTLDIDNDDWNGVNVGPEDTVEIQGEVDKDFTSFEIDVDRVIKK